MVGKLYHHSAVVLQDLHLALVPVQGLSTCGAGWHNTQQVLATSKQQCCKEAEQPKVHVVGCCVLLIPALLCFTGSQQVQTSTINLQLLLDIDQTLLQSTCLYDVYEDGPGSFDDPDLQQFNKLAQHFVQWRTDALTCYSKGKAWPSWTPFAKIAGRYVERGSLICPGKGRAFACNQDPCTSATRLHTLQYRQQRHTFSSTAGPATAMQHLSLL